MARYEHRFLNFVATTSETIASQITALTTVVVDSTDAQNVSGGRVTRRWEDERRSLHCRGVRIDARCQRGRALMALGQTHKNHAFIFKEVR